MLSETRALVEVLRVNIIYMYMCVYDNIFYYFMKMGHILLQETMEDDRNDINNSLEDSLI